MSRVVLTPGRVNLAITFSSFMCLNLTAERSRVSCFAFCYRRVDSKSKIGHTPLHLACRFGHLPVVIVLLAAGAEINARDSDGNTPLHKVNQLYSCMLYVGVAVKLLTVVPSMVPDRSDFLVCRRACLVH